MTPENAARIANRLSLAEGQAGRALEFWAYEDWTRSADTAWIAAINLVDALLWMLRDGDIETQEKAAEALDDIRKFGQRFRNPGDPGGADAGED